MKAITIRGIDEELDMLIKQNARREGRSVNQWILDRLMRNAGVVKEPPFKTYHDIDHLVGGWSKRQYEEFERNTKMFESIDHEVWKYG